MVPFDEREYLMGQSPKQFNDMEAIRKILRSDEVPDRTVAIDGGAHVGSWSVVLAGAFEEVIAFEPCKESFLMLKQNIRKRKLTNVDCRNEALMDSPGRVSVETPTKKQRKLTSRVVRKNPDGDVESTTIDSLGLHRCGLIKLDVEGAEGLAVSGALNTLKRCKPTLIVEIWGQSVRFGHSAIEIHESIVAQDYRYSFRHGVDHVYVPVTR